MSVKTEAQILTDLADLKQRMEELERFIQTYVHGGFPPQPADPPPAPATASEDVCGDCGVKRKYHQLAGHPFHAPDPPQPASGKRWTLCTTCQDSMMEVHFTDPTRHPKVEVVPAAEKGRGVQMLTERRLREELEAAEERNDEQALTIKMLCEEAKAAEAREKGLREALVWFTAPRSSKEATEKAAEFLAALAPPADAKGKEKE